MALQFDGNGQVVIPDWASGTGTWSIRLPSVEHSGTGILIGNDSNNSNFLAFVNADLRFRISGSDFQYSGSFVDGQTYDIEFGYDGTNRFITVDGVKQTSSTAAVNATYNRIGAYNGSTLIYDGLMSGSVVFTGGSQDRNYNTDTSSGTTLTDSTSSQDGTLTGFTTGGFVGGGNPSIEITSPTEQQRYRQRNSNNQHTYTVSGTASNLEAGSIIRYRLDGGAWQTLDAAPTSTFSGTIAVTSTQSVDIEVFDGTDSFSTQTITLRAVAWILGDGQSNMAGRGFTNQPLTLDAGVQTPLALKTSTFSDAADPMGIDGGAAGSWNIRYLSLLSNTRPDITFGFVNVAEGGSSVTIWKRQDLGLYQRITDAYALTGGFEFSITLLGETDASGDMSQADVESNFNEFINNKFNDFGVVTYLVNFPRETYTGDTAIRAGFANVVANNANAFDGGDLRPIDIANTGGDGTHLQTDDQLNQAAQIIFTASSGDLIISSDVTLNVSGIPDGIYKTYLIDQSDSVVYNSNTAFSSGSATLSNLAVAVGTQLEGYVIDSENPHVNGAVITGTTV